MFTLAVAVTSLDGCLTRHDTPGTAFASDADRRRFEEALASSDCLLMGGAGYRAARGRILARLRPGLLRLVLTRDPGRYTADARAGQLEFSTDDPVSALDGLAARGCARCAVVGGPRTLTALARADRLDELWLTIEPTVFGTGVRLFAEPLDQRWELAEMTRLEGDVVALRYLRRGSPRR